MTDMAQESVVRTATAASPSLGLPAWVVRRPLTFIFIVALGVRLTLAVAMSVVTDGAIFGDDASYTLAAEQWASGDTAAWDEQTWRFFSSTATYTLPLALLFEVFGPTPVLGQILASIFGAVTATAVTALLIGRYSRALAVAGGLVVALFPAQVLWSSLALKDSAVWASLSLLALIVAIAADDRITPRGLAGTALAAAVLLVALAHLRDHTMVVAAWALAIAGWTLSGPRRRQRGLALTAVAVIVPWLLAMGPAGVSVVEQGGSLASRRFFNAENAATAFVDTGTTAPTDRAPAGSLSADLAHLPKGLSVMLLEPYPWNWGGNARVNLALLENLLWYPLLGFAAVGLSRAWRYRSTLLYVALVGGGSALVYALAEGNLGTAYRHRGEFVWAVVVLAVAGLRVVSPTFLRSSDHPGEEGHKR